MSEELTRSDWLYTAPKTVSDSDIRTLDEIDDEAGKIPTNPEPRNQHARKGLKTKQSARMYYEVVQESTEQQRILTDYFNRTSSVREIRQEIDELIQQNFPERASETEPPGGNGLPLAAKALAEDDILDQELHQTPPLEDHHGTNIDGTLHWDCDTCDFVARYISWNRQQQPDPYVLCPACDQPF